MTPATAQERVRAGYSGISGYQVPLWLGVDFGLFNLPSANFCAREKFMAKRHGYARVLRTLGQALEKRGIDLFDLRCNQNDFYLQCGDPTPPYLSLVELRYSLGDLNDLDLDARAHRGGSVKSVNFQGLPEILRALGRRVDDKDGQLLRICNSESSAPSSSIKLEYQTHDGRKHVEDLHTGALEDSAMHMYMERTRGSESRSWK